MSNMREAAQEEIRAAERQIETLTVQIKEHKANIKRAEKVLKLYPLTTTAATPLSRVS